MRHVPPRLRVGYKSAKGLKGHAGLSQRGDCDKAPAARIQPRRAQHHSSTAQAPLKATSTDIEREREGLSSFSPSRSRIVIPCSTYSRPLFSLLCSPTFACHYLPPARMPFRIQKTHSIQHSAGGFDARRTRRLQPPSPSLARFGLDPRQQKASRLSPALDIDIPPTPSLSLSREQPPARASIHDTPLRLISLTCHRSPLTSDLFHRCRIQTRAANRAPGTGTVLSLSLFNLDFHSLLSLEPSASAFSLLPSTVDPRLQPSTFTPQTPALNFPASPSTPHRQPHPQPATFNFPPRSSTVKLLPPAFQSQPSILSPSTSTSTSHL